MSLRWNLNESPVSSEKLNKVSITKLIESDRDSLSAQQKIEGMMIYNLTRHRFEYWDGSSWKPFGGGSMLSIIGYKRYGSFNASEGYFLFFASGVGRSNASDTRWQGNTSPALFTSNNATFITNAEHVFYSNIYNLGRPISKVYVTFPCVIGATSSTQTDMSITLASIKFEVLDNTNTVASNTVNMNKSYTKANTTSIYAGHIITSILDVGDKEISDFRFKVEVSSSVTPTNITSHKHYWYADTRDTEPTNLDFHPLEMQVLLL